MGTPANVNHFTPATPFTPYAFTPKGFEPIKTSDVILKKRARRMSLNSNKRHSSIKKVHSSSRKPRLSFMLQKEIKDHPRVNYPTKNVLPSPLRSQIKKI